MIKLWNVAQAIDYHTMTRDNIELLTSHYVDIVQATPYSDMWCCQVDELVLSIKMMLYL